MHVRENYGCAERASALDDRGLVQLRFGSPYKRQPLNYEDGEFFREVYRFGVSVPPGSFHIYNRKQCPDFKNIFSLPDLEMRSISTSAAQL